MIGSTLGRYFAARFFSAAIAVFGGVFVLVVLVDYVEINRAAGDAPNATAMLLAKISFFRVPQVTEEILPFSILVGAMVCYLNLSRRLELVIARAAGISAWQFLAPAVVVALFIGVVATTVYNPIAAHLREISKRLEADVMGRQTTRQAGGLWIRQRSPDGQAIINAAASRDLGLALDGVTIFTFDNDGRFEARIDAKSAAIKPGHWLLSEVRILTPDSQARTVATYELKTNLTRVQVQDTFSTPESLSFWELPGYIELAEQSGVGTARFRLQYQLLLARPFLLCAMLLIAGAVSLRFFRFGGVTKMVLGGLVAGFLLYVLSKVTEDLGKADLMSPVAAAWLPPLVGGLFGFVALLYQEDG